MTWQQLKYGTIVAAGLATSGTLWYVRTDRVVLARDAVEIWQGANERYWAAYSPEGDYDHTPEALAVTTNTYYTWTNTSSYSYPEYSTNGTETLLPFMERQTNSIVTTNYSGSRTIDLGPAKVQVGYFMFGGYTQYVASGFANADYNQTYTFEHRERSLLMDDIFFNYAWLSVSDVYTNDANSSALVLFGPVVFWKSEFEEPCAALIDSYSSKNWYSYVDCSNAYTFSPWTVGGGTVVGSGSVTSNRIWRGPAIEEHYTYSEHLYYPQNAIGRLTSERIVSQSAAAIDLTLAGTFRDAIYLDTESKTGDFYVVTGEFDYSDFPALSASNAFLRAGITNLAWSHSSPRIVRKGDLTERNDVMSQMNEAVTYNSSIDAWTNIWVGSSSGGSYTNWEAAKAAAEADLHITNGVSVSEGFGAWSEGYAEWVGTNDLGEAVYTNVKANILVYPWSQVSSFVDTSAVCAVDFYVYVPSGLGNNDSYIREFFDLPANPDWNLPNQWDTTCLSNFMDESSYTNNIFIASLTNQQTNSIILDVLAYTNAPTVPWCDDPLPYLGASTTEVSTCRGFTIQRFDLGWKTFGEAVHKWSFEHCTNMVYTP